MTRVDQLLERARRAEPDALDDMTSRRMIERALASRGDVVVEEQARRGGRWAFVAAAAAVAALAWLVWPRASVEPVAPMEVSLSTGDRLVGTDGARFDLERIEPADRRVRLRAGVMLFDVARVVAGQHFVVATGDLEVTATGTVFQVDARGPSVRVWQGSVSVAMHGHEVARMRAGESWGDELATELPVLVAAEHAAAHLESAQIASARIESPQIASAQIATPERAKPAELEKRTDVEAARPVEKPAHDVRRVETPPDDARRIEMPAIDARSSDTDMLAAAKADIAAARYADALAVVDAAHGTSAAWKLVEADAARATSDTQRAADAYDAAAKLLTGDDHLEAAYAAAYLRWKNLHDADGALASLGDVPHGATLEERALALQLQILHGAKRDTDARPVAARYLAAFPHGDLRALAKKLEASGDR